MEPLETGVYVERFGNVAVVSLVGDHDIVTALDVRRALDSEAASGHGVVVSLEDTEFFDSSIVHTFVATERRLHEKGRGLVLHVGTPSIVERVLEISGLSQCLRRTASLDEAIVLAGFEESIACTSH